jgi:tetratricopeptide (TPR) repeat protein
MQATCSVRNDYYKCKFSLIKDGVPDDAPIEQLLIRASALFELNESAAARATLELATSRAETTSDCYKHALARLAYMSQDYKQAREIWDSLYETSRDSHYRFSALLGIANTLNDEQDYEQLALLVDEIDCAPSQIDDQICLAHFQGHYELNTNEDPIAARRHFIRALKLASGPGWTYWQIRSYIGLALAAKAADDRSTLKVILEVVDEYLANSDAMFLRKLVQETFPSELATTPRVLFDRSNMKIAIRDHWLALGEKPMIFDFLALLHERAEFVDKKALAEALWPAEEYRPRTHDPRIFDIAKRIRAMLRELPDQSKLELLSGRRGYRLAGNL